MSGVEGFSLTDIIVVLSWSKKWTIENATQQTLLLLVELAIQTQYGRGP
jgi:hypothetical protein